MVELLRGWVCLALAVPAILDAAGDLRAQTREADPLPARPLDGTREFLQLYGVDDDAWQVFDETGTWSNDERAILHRILFRLPRVNPVQLQRWAASTWQEELLAQAPQTHRGKAFRVTGVVDALDVLEVPAAQVEYLGYSRYYRLRLRSLNANRVRHVVARSVPDRWIDAPLALAEPATVDAVFLKVGNELDRNALVFAAHHVAWFPQRPNAGLGVHADHVFLAQHGMDIGRWDEIRRRNRKPVEAEDREAFYQLLAAMNRATPHELATRVLAPFELPVLLQKPQSAHGRLVRVRGTVRRVTKVLVGDADVQQRFGLRAYYQLDLFVPLDSQVVRFEVSDEKGEVPEFANSYPVTVCVTQLPEGIAEGADLRYQVRMPAAFFKLWVYRSKYVASFDPRQLQPGPLFIGKQPELIQPGRTSEAALSLAMGSLFLAFLAGLWLLLWSTGRRDSRVRRDLMRRRENDLPFD